MQSRPELLHLPSLHPLGSPKTWAWMVMMPLIYSRHSPLDFTLTLPTLISPGTSDQRQAGARFTLFIVCSQVESAPSQLQLVDWLKQQRAAPGSSRLAPSIRETSRGAVSSKAGNCQMDLFAPHKTATVHFVLALAFMTPLGCRDDFPGPYFCPCRSRPQPEWCGSRSDTRSREPRGPDGHDHDAGRGVFEDGALWRYADDEEHQGGALHES